MADKIQQARRAAFEAAYEPEIHRIAASYGVVKADILRAYRVDDFGVYESRIVQAAWKGFNAALDCVVIELPEPHFEFEGDTCGELFDSEVRAAIESTNLGIKVK